MSETIALAELDGLRLLRLALLPGRSLTLTLFGLRANLNNGHSHSEVLLQFIQPRSLRIAGTLNNGAALRSEGAVKESGIGETQDGIRRYELFFESAQIDLSASDYVCWLVANQKLPSEDERLLGEILAKRASTGFGQRSRAKRSPRK